ncbi:MAG: hypothetical protein ACREX9_04075 [Gammaproteobacteria bacterium]
MLITAALFAIASLHTFILLRERAQPVAGAAGGVALAAGIGLLAGLDVARGRRAALDE